MTIENANENQKLHLRLLLYVAQSCHKIPCLDEVVSQAKKCFRIMRLHRALRLRETIYQLKIFCVELLEEKRFIWQNLSPFHNIQYFFFVFLFPLTVPTSNHLYGRKIKQIMKFHKRQVENARGIETRENIDYRQQCNVRKLENVSWISPHNHKSFHFTSLVELSSFFSFGLDTSNRTYWAVGCYQILSFFFSRLIFFLLSLDTSMYLLFTSSKFMWRKCNAVDRTVCGV